MVGRGHDRMKPLAEGLLGKGMVGVVERGQLAARTCYRSLRASQGTRGASALPTAKQNPAGTTAFGRCSHIDGARWATRSASRPLTKTEPRRQPSLETIIPGYD